MPNSEKNFFESDDFVPVLGSYPGEAYRRRFVRAEKSGKDKSRLTPKKVSRGARSLVASLLREDFDFEEENTRDTDSIIPDDAEVFVPSADPFNKGNGSADAEYLEGEDESSEEFTDTDREPLMSPAVALTAPDATPKAYEPLDPSEVPDSGEESLEKERAQQKKGVSTVEKDAPAVNASNQSKSKSTDKLLPGKTIPSGQRTALDVLLGRNKAEVAEGAGDSGIPVVPKDPNQALNMLGLGVSSELLRQQIMENAKQGVPMPDPPAPASMDKFVEIMRRLER